MLKHTAFLLFTLWTASWLYGGDFFVLRLSGDGGGIRMKDFHSAPGTHFLCTSRKNALYSFRVVPAPENSGTEWQKYSVHFVPDRHGLLQLELTGGSADEGALFDDFQLTGAKLLNPGFEEKDGGIFRAWQNRPENCSSTDCAEGKYAALVSSRNTVKHVFRVEANRKVTLSFQAKKAGAPPPPYTPKSVNLKYYHYRKADYYLFQDSRIKLLPADDRGVWLGNLSPRYPWIAEEKLRPHWEYAVPAAADAADASFQLHFTLPAEKFPRKTAVRTGVPLPRGKFRSTRSLSLRDSSGTPVAACFTPIAWWPDKSVKAALLEFPVSLPGGRAAKFCVTGVPAPHPVYPPLSVREERDRFVVRSGELTVAVNKRKFNFLSSVRWHGHYLGRFGDQGIELLSPQNMPLETPLPAEPVVQVEELNPLHVTFRAEGVVGNWQRPTLRYTVRIHVFAGSPVVEMAMRFHSADRQSEFRDFRSMVLKFYPASPVTALRMEEKTGKRFLQPPAGKSLCDGAPLPRPLSGAGTFLIGTRPVRFALADCRMRAPKGFRNSTASVDFELLPEQTSPEESARLPHYLRYPFCEGLYRLKLGSAFDETLRIDFSGELPFPALAAPAPVPVWDPADLARTGVFPDALLPASPRQREWDQRALQTLRKLLAKREANGEYGFLNCGDFFGGSGRDWYNNANDLAAGLFRLYLRSGDLSAYRTALALVRHTASTDTVHDSFDPSYIGGQAAPGVGHTGMGARRKVVPAPWSFPHNPDFSGESGNLHLQGEAIAWMLTGDAMIGDSLLLSGEHLRRYAAPMFCREGSGSSAGGILEGLRALYRVTGDKRCLQEAEKLRDQLLADQALRSGGAWPDNFPDDDAARYSGRSGLCGCGVLPTARLLSELEKMQKRSPSPAAQKQLPAARKALLRGFRKDGALWPRRMNWDGAPVAPPDPAASLFTAAALLPGEKKIAAALLDRIAVTGFSTDVPVFAAELAAVPHLLQSLAPAETPSPLRCMQNLLQAPPPVSVGGPKGVSYTLRLTAPAGKLRLTRLPDTAQPAPRGEYQLTVTDKTGKKRLSRRGGVTTRAVQDLTLTGKPGEMLTLTIRDGFPGFWQLIPGKGVSASLHVSPDTWFDGTCGQRLLLQRSASSGPGRVTVEGSSGGAGAMLFPRGENKTIPETAAKHFHFSLPGGAVLALPAAQEGVLLVLSCGPFRLKLDGFSEKIPL